MQASYLGMVLATARVFQAAPRSAAVFLTMALLAGTVACGPAAPSPAELIGTWEKPDTSLPS